MICNQLSSLLGFDCSPLSEGGEIALVSTPFKFDDGDALPVFVEVVCDRVRFFDDGQTLMHFIGRGVRIENKKNANFLTSTAQKCGAEFTDAGEIQVWGSLENAKHAFAKYLSSMIAFSAWEREQRGVNTDATLFVEEVAMALRAWKPTAKIELAPCFEGISEREYKLDFMVDGEAVIATSAHPNAISSVLHRLVDIRGRLANAEAKFLVVIDDRNDPDAANREALIVQSVATVMPFSSLEVKSGRPAAAH